ncbi:MAG: aldo/keto reductase [Anaerolineae bacterium]|nr:aldo/keto reductase [Anaerolineae bacterium]
MKGLEKRRIPRMGMDVTFIGFGALEIGRDWGLGDADEKRRPDDEAAGEVLRAVLDLGITLVDTASAYHRSEERIGRTIADRRAEYVLASKCGEHSDEPRTFYDFTYDGISASIDRSLRLLQTDVIDLMQIHFGPDPAGVLDRGETVAAMKDAQRAGKVRFLGASIDGALATRCIESGDFDVMQLGYSLVAQGNTDNIRLAQSNGIGVLIRSGLAAGALTARVIPHLHEEVRHVDKIRKLLDLVGGDGDALTALALNFLYENDGISSVLVGSKRAEHVRANLDLLERPVDPEVMAQATEIGRG